MNELDSAPSTTPGPEHLRPSPTCIVYDGAGRPKALHELAQISDVLRDSDAFVWLDVIDPQPVDVALITEEFGLHPLAIEDALREHDHPKIEAYTDSWFVIVHGVTRTGDSLRIHELGIFVGAQFVVTVRTLPAYPLDEVERRWELLGPSVRRDSGAMLYTILDTVVDGYLPISAAFEERVTALETALLGDPGRTTDVLMQIYQMKKELTGFRRAVIPVKDILAPILRGDLQLFGADEMPYYRDVYDHVRHVIDQMDNTRELVNNARDTHISLATNRQNEVSKQLTIVATVFLPLTFITGFFGQNFGFLVNNIASAQTFAIWGIGSEIIALGALFIYFRFKGWF